VLVAVLILFVTFSHQGEKVRKEIEKGLFNGLTLHNISYAMQKGSSSILP